MLCFTALANYLVRNVTTVTTDLMHGDAVSAGHSPPQSTTTTTLVLSVLLSAAVPLVSVLSYCYQQQRRQRRKQQIIDDASHHDGSTVQQDLAEHSKIFDKQIIRVKEDVLVATGYALANVIIIRSSSSNSSDDGQEVMDGLIIIDTTESNEAAAEILTDVRKIEGYGPDLPVVGIIYTHFHSDHVGGTDAFLNEAASDDVEIWAHHSTKERLLEFNLVMGPIAFRRGARQFGMQLDAPQLENCGIGPRTRVGRPGNTMSSVVPNRTYGDGDDDAKQKTINIAGVTLELIHAPGETDDQTVVFMPRHQILFAADNYYESFPNLYAIRGVPHRDATQWMASLDTMRATRPAIMVPAHSLPINGQAEIDTRLRNYRDAISFVHDQTVRLALKGEHPDTIANQLQLPVGLRTLEYLKEFYGTVHWSAKAIFCGYLGWFSGEPAELLQLDPSERATRVVALGGGPDPCLDVVEQSIGSGDLQWALELVTAVLKAEPTSTTSQSQERRATELRVEILTRLGEQQISANARNYYLTSAMETKGDLVLKIPKNQEEHHVMTSPIDRLFNLLTYRVDADSAEGQDRLLRVNFTDTQQTFLLILHNSTMKIITPTSGVPSNEDNVEGDVDGEFENGETRLTRQLREMMGSEWENIMTSVTVTCEEVVWRKMLVYPLSLGPALMAGSFRVTEGSIVDFKRFMQCLDRKI